MKLEIVRLNGASRLNSDYCIGYFSKMPFGSQWKQCSWFRALSQLSGFLVEFLTSKCRFNLTKLMLTKHSFCKGNYFAQ